MRERGGSPLREVLSDLVGAGEALFISTEEGRLLEANQAAAALTGYGRPELLGLSLPDLLPALSGASPDAPTAAAMLRRDGTLIKVSLSQRPLELPGARLLLTTARLREADRLAALLEESERRHQTLVDNALVGIYRTSLSGEILYANQALATMLGFERPSDLMGVDIRPMYAPPGQRQRLLDLLQQGGRVSGFEANFYTRQGEVRTFLLSAHLEGGVLSGMIMDITERVRAEAALRQALAESERRATEVSALLEAAAAVLEYRRFEEAARAIYDACKKLLGASAGYVALLSADGSRNDVLFLDAGGHACCVDPALPMPIRGLRAQALRLKYAVYDNNFSASLGVEFLPAGHAPLRSVLFAPLIIDTRAVGLLGLANKPGGFSEDDARMAQAFGDIAAVALQNSRNLEMLKAREAELARQKRELERSNEDLQQFAYVASHDLQEPLRMVGSFTQLLARRYQDRLDPAADDFISYVLDGVKRMQTLINDLLAYSRVGSGGQAQEPADSRAALQRALANLQLAIEESGAEVSTGELPVVAAVPSQLTQLFQNLLGNAVKFRGQAPPRIHVWAERAGEEWRFAVRDNGIGLDPAYAERIFLIFQRLHNKAEYPGTGIGLAICKKIVARHGGRIWVESRPGAGATFYFTIPAGE